MRAHRDASLVQSRAECEAEKAIRFASLHGEWPLDLSDAAGRALARRPDAATLEERWGNLVENALAH